MIELKPSRENKNMKNELKISALSIVCVLCASVSLSAGAASSVRSLGGAGTYNGASSAVAAKTGDGSSAAGAIDAVRAGSVRVNNVAAGSGAGRTGVTRTNTAPRLSIGKYLAGSSAVSGGSSVSGSHAGKPGQGGTSGGTSGDGADVDVKYLEEFVGYDVNGMTLPEQLSDIKLDIEALSSDLSGITGAHTVVDYADGVLTVTLDGESPVSYDLSERFAGVSEVEALQKALDDLQAPDGALAVYVNEVVEEALVNFEIPDASITAEKLATGSVGAEHINSGVGNAGEMMMLISNGDGTSSWVSVTVDAE